MSVFTLAISCLTTSNLPWFRDPTIQVPMQYCSYSIRLASITSHIHNRVLFWLWLCLFVLSGVISPLISSGLLGTYQPGEFLFQCPIFLPFMLFMGFSRQESWSPVFVLHLSEGLGQCDIHFCYDRFSTQQRVIGCNPVHMQCSREDKIILSLFFFLHISLLLSLFKHRNYNLYSQNSNLCNFFWRRTN